MSSWRNVNVLCVLVIGLAVGTVASPLRGDVPDDEKVVNQLIEAMTDNRDRLRTWTGQVEIVDTYKTGDQEPVVKRQTIDFLQDRKRGITRNVVRSHGPHPFTRPDGSSGEVRENLIGNRMVQNGALLCLDDIPDGKAPPRTRVLRVREGPTSREETLIFFDPTTCFFEPGRSNAASLLNTLRPALRNEKHPLRVSRTQDRVTLESSTVRTVNRYVFDPSKAGNLVEFYAETDYGKPPKAIEQITVEYTVQNGVVVPAKWRWRLQTRTVDGRSSSKLREVVFVRNEVNKVIKAEELTVEAMGVKIGDVIRDDRTERTTRYTGDYAPEPTTRPTSKARSTSTTTRPSQERSSGLFGEAFWIAVLGLPLLVPIACSWQQINAVTFSTSWTWNSIIGFWAPRIVGITLVVGAFGKVGNIETVQKVLAFDGFPQWMIPGLAWLVLLGELVLGQSLIVGWGGRKTFAVVIVLFVVYCLQLGLLLIHENAPDCGCFLVLKAFANRRHGYMIGLARNFVFLAMLLYAYRVTPMTKRC